MLFKKRGTGHDDVRHPSPDALSQPQKLAAPGRGGPVPRSSTPPEPSHELSDELLAHQAALEIRNAQLEEARERIDKERKKFNHLFDAAPVGYLILNRRGEITEVNLTFALMTGSSHAQLMGQPFLNFITKSAREEWRHFLHKVFLGVTLESSETTLETPEGRTIDVVMDCILNNSGHACLLAITDISGLKRAVEERFINAKLDSFGVMAGGIAHDFNNLLSVILMNLDLSRMLIPPSADLQHLMDEANKAVKQATALTQRLLTLAEGGAPVCQPIKLDEFIRHTVELALAGSAVKAKFHIDDGLWATKADPRQFERVIRNVIMNAVEAMPDGGTIEVAARNEELVAHGPTTLPDGKYIRLSMRDHGPGIAHDLQASIFDPYFSTKRRGTKTGLGLGLATCYSIMKKHEGAILVESEPGQGVEVILLLPVTAFEPGTAEVAAFEPEASPRLGRVLLMDDEDGVRKSVTQVLQAFGHDVAVAVEGQEAVDLYRQALREERRFDVVLIDLTVRAGLGGRETIEALRLIDPAVKAVVMSGFTQDPVIMNYEDYGFCDYLIKPFGRAQLREVLGKLLKEKPVEEVEPEIVREKTFDNVLIVRPLRDKHGRCVDAVIEHANRSWREDFGYLERDPRGVHIKDTVPVYADRIGFIFQVAESGEPFRYVRAMPGDDSRWFDYQMMPYGDKVIIFSHEVTREYRLEFAVRESEERLRAALEHSPDVVALFRPVYDTQGHFTDVEITYLNRAALEQWCAGAPLEEVRGRRLFEVNPASRKVYHEIYRGVSETAREFHNIIEITGSGGEAVWMDVRVTMFLGGIALTTRDVSEIKRGEQALKNSLEELQKAQRDLHRTKEQLEATLNALPDIVFRLDHEGHIIDAHAASVFSFFRPPSEFLGKAMEEVVPPAAASVIRDGLRKAEEHTLFRGGVYSLPMPEGETWYEISIAKIDNRPLLEHQFIMLVRDITERRNFEARLLDRQQELAEAQQTAHVGSWKWRPADDLLQCSDEFFRIFGQKPVATTVAGQALQDYFTTASRKILRDGMKASRESGEPLRANAELVLASGEHRYVLVHGELKSREPEEWRGTISDVTDTYLAQQRLNQAQRNELIGRLAGGVAHDFNNQLQSILGITELLLSTMDPAQPEYEHVLDIQKAGEHSAELTRQLLAFSRRQMTRPVVIKLNDEVEDIMRMVQRLLGEGVTLNWEPGEKLEPVLMDAGQLKQIMINLCINARDAMRGRGVITIRTANFMADKAFCSSRPDFTIGPYVMLSVRDNGSGMSEEVRAHIFEPFYSTKEFGDGAGLGLATVEGAVRQNNGVVEVESALEQGTTFRIYFPGLVAKPKPSPRPPSGRRARPPAADVPMAQGETVMIIDDERQVLDIGRRLLENLGYITLEAKNADEAIELARTHPGNIELLLTDVIMPDLNGPDLAREIKSIRPGIKILFMSGYTADQLENSGIPRDEVALLEKPFNLSTLAQMIRQVLAVK
jgi:PAS domain S-box-containing protein